MSDSALNVWTAQDALDLLNDYLGQNAAGVNARDMRRAVIESYDELCAERKWSHFTRPRYFELHAAVSGTLFYTESTRLFTIDAGTFPTWAEGATLSIGDVRYRIAALPSTTTATPVVGLEPIADIATGTPFTLYQGTILLPENFQSLVKPLDESNVSYDTIYVPPEEWEFYNRYDSSTGHPVMWTIMADPNYLTRQALHLWPAPDSDRTLSFVGRYYPRNVRRFGYLAAEFTGTVSVSGNTATGVGTSFTADMIGSIIRISNDATNYPDGPGGNNPYAYQRIITAVGSTTSLTTGGDAISTSGKKFRISDPLDVSRPMLDAVWRGCERKVAGAKKGTADQDRAEQRYETALMKAKSSDSNIPSGKMSPWQRKVTRSQWVIGEDDLS